MWKCTAKLAITLFDSGEIRRSALYGWARAGHMEKSDSHFRVSTKKMQNQWDHFTIPNRPAVAFQIGCDANVGHEQGDIAAAVERFGSE